MADYWFNALLAAATSVEVPIDGQTGVWLKSGGAVISSAMKMTGATITSGQTQYIYSRGVAQSCLFTQSSTQSVYIGGAASGCVYAGVYPIFGRIYGGTLVGGSVGAGAIVSATSGAIVRDMDVTVSLCILSAFGSNIRGSNGCTIVAGDYVGSSSGVIDGLTISGGRLIVAWTGQVTNATVVGSAQIFHGGAKTYVDATINGGSMLISSNYLSGYYCDPSIGGFVNISWSVGTMTSCGFGSGQVLQGGMATQIDIYSKCDYHVRGSLSGATVESGGTLTVSSGGIASNTTVSSGGTAILSGGTLTNCIDEWRVYISSGGVAHSVTVKNSAQCNVYTGGTMTDIVVSSNGRFTVQGGAILSGCTRLDGATYCYILSGGTAYDVHNYYGRFAMSSGGYVSGLYQHPDAGTYTVNDPARIDDLHIDSDATVVLQSGVVASAVQVSGGASLTVSSGGTALAVTSSAGATVIVAEGGYIEYVTP